MNAQIPIVHLYGGEATEGLIDEAVRNATTKLSYLHFTSTEEYRHRVVQMGENPQRVYTAGAIGVENTLHTNFMSSRNLKSPWNVRWEKKIAVLTFHPVTLEHNTAEIQIGELIKAINTIRR